MLSIFAHVRVQLPRLFIKSSKSVIIAMPVKLIVNNSYLFFYKLTFIIINSTD